MARILDERGRIFGKVNIVDILVLLVIVAVVVFAKGLIEAFHDALRVAEHLVEVIKKLRERVPQHIFFP